MENNNTMAKYMGRNLKKIISNLEIIQGTAKDTGNIYYCLEITLINGHKYRKFLRGAEEFAFTNAFDLLETETQVDVSFD